MNRGFREIKKYLLPNKEIKYMIKLSQWLEGRNGILIL